MANAYEALTYQDVQSTVPTPTYQFGDYSTGRWQDKWNNYTAQVNNAWQIYSMNKRMEEREDSAYQRMKTDLLKAGMNPFYIMNQSSASPVSSSGYKTFKADKSKSSDMLEKLLSDFVSGAFGLFKIMTLIK